MFKRHAPNALSNLLLGTALSAYFAAFVAMFSLATGIGPTIF